MRTVGVGTRTLNFIIDTLLIFLLSYAAYEGWAFYALYWHIIYFQYYIFFWAVMFVYYLFFESIFKRSPGKWVTATKVVNQKGGRPSFIQIFVRSLVRLTLIDCFFIPFIDKTLHDYLSKTEVVEV